MAGRCGVWVGIVLGLVLGVAPACAEASHHRRTLHWVASWAMSPEAPGPGDSPAGGFRDETIREVIFTSAGGTLARLRFDNTFGTRELVIGAAAVGVAGAGAAVVPGTNVELTFGGRRETVIPPGGQKFSDPVRMSVRPLESLAVSLFLPGPTGPPTQHNDTHQVNSLAAGNHVLADQGSSYSRFLEHWYFVSGLDVVGGARAALVALGDSITNGDGSLIGANRDWPDDLARRLQAKHPGVLSVVDAGIDGNRVLNPSPSFGPSALARFGPDVLQQSGVREVILLEGINDIGFGSALQNVTAQQVIAGYQQLIARAHAAGLKIFGATLTPFGGSQHWTPAGEAKRDAINAWIRSSGAFDGVIDFASAVAEPGYPERLRPRYDWGDHLHMNDAGYQAMANAINLAMLLRGVGVR